MKIEHFKFETPAIIGILSDRTVSSNIRRRLDSIIKRKRLPYVCLPFKVESKHLKNVIACMRLMDIAGLIVIGNHSKRIRRFIPRLDGGSKKSGIVNAVKRQRKEFHGYCVNDGPSFYMDAVNLLTSKSPSFVRPRRIRLRRIRRSDVKSSP
jgi:shikimate 5-dehydrogenase